MTGILVKRKSLDTDTWGEYLVNIGMMLLQTKASPEPGVTEQRLAVEAGIMTLAFEKRKGLIEKLMEVWDGI